MLGDYASIEIFSYRDFKQVGEYFGNLGQLYKLSDIVKEVTKEVYKRSSGRVILCIENNSMGNSIIEDLEKDDKFDYVSLIYKEEDKEVLGIHTNVKNRDLMISEAYQVISEDPGNVRSRELITEITSLERKGTGRIEASSGSKDDCFFAMAFCAFVRRKTLLEYLPLIEKTSEEINNVDSDLLKSVIRFNMFPDDSRRNLNNEMLLDDRVYFSSEDELNNGDYNDEYSSFTVF